jgi:hypothetical protein
VKNPIAWVLLALFAIAEYGNYQRGTELTLVCEGLLGASGAEMRVDDGALDICNERLSEPYDDDRDYITPR